MSERTFVVYDHVRIDRERRVADGSSWWGGASFGAVVQPDQTRERDRVAVELVGRRVARAGRLNH